MFSIFFSSINRWNLLLSTSSYPTLSFHALNLILHFTIEILLGRICRKLLNFDSRTSFFVCLLHAVHPVNVEAVASIVGRADLLCAAFTLSSLLCFNTALSESSSKSLISSIIFSILALGSKETGLTSLVLCALLWFNKRASRNTLSTIPFFAIILSVRNIFPFPVCNF